MKRILCVVSSLNAGGAETFLMKIFRTIDRTKYMFDFIVSADGVYDEEVIQLGGKIHKVSLRTKAPLKVLTEIKNIVKTNNYKYFFKLTDTPLGGILDIIAAKLGGAEWISVRSCNAITNAPKYKELINSILRPFFNCLINCKIAPSDLAATYTFGKRQVRKGNIHFIHNGVDLNVFRYDENAREEIRKQLQIPHDALVIGHVGRFNHQKNHEYLLKVFDEIHKLDKNTYFLLVGVGELQEKIKNLASSLSLKDSICFTGLRKDVPKILSAIDAFVLPSFYEGMPNVVIEGQATGLPCFVSDTVTREANITGLVQYLSIQAHPHEWADAILKVNRFTRKDTTEAFISAGYDIKDVTKTLIQLIFREP